MAVYGDSMAAGCTWRQAVCTRRAAVSAAGMPVQEVERPYKRPGACSKAKGRRASTALGTAVSWRPTLSDISKSRHHGHRYMRAVSRPCLCLVNGLWGYVVLLPQILVPAPGPASWRVMVA